MKKRYLLLLVLALMTLLAGCSMPEEKLNFDIDKDTAVSMVKSIVDTYDGVSDLEYDYYINDGSDLEKSAVSGFRAAQTTDHVGGFVSYDTSGDKVTLKNGARGNILCSVICKYENRDVKVTVSFVQNRAFEVQKEQMKKDLEENANYNGVDTMTLLQYYFADYGYDLTDEDTFLSQYVIDQFNMYPYTPDECEVSAVYSTKELISKAGINTAIGMGVVFCVLIFIAFIIYLLRFVPKLLGTEIAGEKGEAKNAKKTKTDKKNKPIEKGIAETKKVLEKTLAEKSAAAPSENLVNDAQLVAVITAAISAYIESSSGTVKGPVMTDSKDKLVVRSIRKVR
jgi:Oxaloacetate decarboxylase, gamma chain.